MRSGQLRRAWRRFSASATAEDRAALDAFARDPRRRSWLDDWTLFSALRRHLAGRSWPRWPAPARARHPEMLDRLRDQLGEDVAFERFVQFCFHRHWELLHAAARARGVELFGDVPYYVAGDSADVWAHPGLFSLDERGRARHVGGVPPDYFSRTGQRWGNPVYRWDRMREDGYSWWIARLGAGLARFDRLRLDHFRGFVEYWEVAGHQKTAEHGRWRPGPGRALFEALRRELGDLPLVAEDLGTITPDVEQLRDELGLPGVRVLQFDYAGTDPPPAPASASVVYTGTHDNDTTRGWLEALHAHDRHRVLERLRCDSPRAVWRLIETAYASPAGLCVIPVQDLLGLPAAARMNHPGVTRGNWEWRVPPGSLTLELAARLRSLAEAHGRA
jgi:4-alpha-glucanotransferase